MKKSSPTRFIFITGGVVSSLGKGLTSATMGALLQARGFSVRLRKLDPYLNVDPGTMSPAQHGEVFVTEDGGETDLDLGHYERFTEVYTTRSDNITAGSVYHQLLTKERRGDYLGQTVQVIPHVIDLIISFIMNNSDEVDFVICEIGGTVGDIESQPFLESIRQVGYKLGRELVIFLHLTLVPYIGTVGELKTKPTQHSVKELSSLGIQPDIVLYRSKAILPAYQTEKIANFCNVPEDNIIPALDVDNIYTLPTMHHAHGLDIQVLKHFGIQSAAPDLSKWLRVLDMFAEVEEEVTVAVVGKYVTSLDAYTSLMEALKHAGIHAGIRVNIELLSSRLPISELDLSNVDGVLIPGGFGDGGTQTKLAAITYARVNNIPMFGICLGMQLAVIEFASNVLHLDNPGSTEFEPNCKNPVVIELERDCPNYQVGGSMRLGAYTCLLQEGSKIFDVYGGASEADERCRHRYGINPIYRDVFEKHGLLFTGVAKVDNLLEVIELVGHPWFIGVQFHPEFKSSPFKSHPLFLSFIKGCLASKHARRQTQNRS